MINAVSVKLGSILVLLCLLCVAGVNAQQMDHAYHRQIDSLWNYCYSSDEYKPREKFTKKIIRQQKMYSAKWEYKSVLMDGDSLLSIVVSFDVKKNLSQDEFYLVRNNELVYAGVFHTQYGSYPNGLKREPSPVAASSYYFRDEYAGREYPPLGDVPLIWKSPDAVRKQFLEVYSMLKTELKKM